MQSDARWTIREAGAADSATLADLHVACWRESYRDLVPAPMLAALSVGDRDAMWRRVLAADGGADETRVFLAECGSTPAGFAACGRQRTARLRDDGYDGEIGALYLRRAFQRRGLGRRLFAAAASDLHARGFQAVASWVLTANDPARRFYERLGGRTIGSREDVRDGHALAEIAYGWAETAAPGGRSEARP